MNNDAYVWMNMMIIRRSCESKSESLGNDRLGVICLNQPHVIEMASQ